MKLKDWDSETMANYPSLAAICYLLGAGGNFFNVKRKPITEITKATNVYELIERYASKYLDDFNVEDGNLAHDSIHDEESHPTQIKIQVTQILHSAQTLLNRVIYLRT